MKTDIQWISEAELPQAPELNKAIADYKKAKAELKRDLLSVAGRFIQCDPGYSLSQIGGKWGSLSFGIAKATKPAAKAAVGYHWVNEAAKGKRR